jgi:hypothetical protein
MNDEYRELRATIRERGSLRVLVFVGTLAAWALTAGLVAGLLAMPLAALLPLAVLAGGFEAINALHAGAERIGRYLYVRYESGGGDAKTRLPSPGTPMWETAIAAFGAGQHATILTRPANALFSVVFIAAVAISLLVDTLGATRQELIAVALLHAAVIVRILAVSREARAQRAKDQARFEQILRS